MKKPVQSSLLSIFCLLVTSCIYDDPTTYDPSCGQYIEVHSADGNDAQVSALWVYVYDENGALIGLHNSEPGARLSVGEYRDRGKIKVVVWGNASGQGAPQSLPDPILGSSIKAHQVVQHIFGSVVVSPSDLFFGFRELDFSKELGLGQAVTIVLVDRVVSRFAVTIRGIGQAFDGTGADYWLDVRHPYSAFDFSGNPIGSPSLYRPRVVYNPLTDQLTSEVSLALPTGEQGVVVDLYSNGRLVYTATVDGSGNVLLLTRGKFSNILIDLSRQIDVLVLVGGWGDLFVLEEFSSGG